MTPTVVRIFRMIDGSAYRVESETERDAIENVERVFDLKTWKAIEIVGSKERERQQGAQSNG